MRYSQDFIDKVIDANNLVDLISQYTQLKSSGSNLMGLCPFPDHNEKSPSFSVSASKQLYHCFGCKKSGNIISWLQQYNGMSFVESIEFLAEKAGVPLPEPELNSAQKQKYQQNKDVKKQLLRVNELARNRFQTNLEQAPQDVKSYVQSRKLTEEIIDKFQIGYAKDAWDDLINYLQRNGGSEKQAGELGLSKRRKTGNGSFDIFRNRLMFPILSPSNEVLGFGGRVLKKEDNPKYLNSPESLVFHKGRTLYGLHETAKHILTEDQVIVVEGYMDLLALYSAGIKNCVANLGTAFTDDHAKLLKRYTKNVVVLFDGDDAGQTAAERSMPILYGQALYPKILSLPEKLDPDEYIDKHGIESFRDLLAKPQDLYFWYLSRVLRDFDRTPTGQIKAVDRLFPALSKIADNRLRELYLKETAERLGVEFNWLRDTLRQMWKDARQKTSANSAATSQNFSEKTNSLESKDSTSDSAYLDLKSLMPSELELLKICLLNEELLKNFLVGNDFAYLSTKTAKEIFAELHSYYGQDASSFDKLPGLVVKKLRDPSVITQILNGDLYEDEGRVQKLYTDCVEKLKVEATKNELKELRMGLKDGLPEDKLQRYMELVNSHKAEKRTNS
ncbi:MAG: DNA primase [Bdellovibrionota bacterium]|nr:DNA primase [Pseudobdellovibrionaceae bacterium]|tara:strand:- start:60776 stop:62626 length:1851 start_codon:yes stop_codon:yes gene_type:complete